MAGVTQGAALPTPCCHAMRGVTVGVRAGRGPGWWLLPSSHAKDGAGIDVIHDVSGDSANVAHPARVSVATTQQALRSACVISTLRPARPISPACRAQRRL